jgi:2-oxoglutarate dehydrogenase E2 component (dihydrolipoamide succinyltransferase)
MIIEVKMPQLGESLTEGTIIKWWKTVGDLVQKDETILEVSTDKVDSEIPSPVQGIVVEILAKENETIGIDEILAKVETKSDGLISKESEEKVGKGRERDVDSRIIEKISDIETIAPKNTKRFYSPLVLTISQKEGISLEELEDVPGKGINGRVTKKDILNYLKTRSTSINKKEAASPSNEFKTIEREVVLPMDAVRKKIALHMRNSLDTAAHVYSVSECNMTSILNLISKKKEIFFKEQRFKLTVTPFLLQAVTKAILDFPRINCSIDKENIIEKRYINLGVAVATEKGLIVPVLKNAEEKSFMGLARAIDDLITRARKNELILDDVQGSTFTITNYGVFGNILGFPIINQPNVAILGFGAIKKRPMVIETAEQDTIGIRSMVYISMSYDHRVVDGELGGRFMQRLVEYLEAIDDINL